MRLLQKYFSLMLLLFTGAVLGQNPDIATVQRSLLTAKNDTGKIKTLINLSWQLFNTGRYDTALYFTSEAKGMAEKLLQTPAKSADPVVFALKKQLARTYNITGLVYETRGEFPAALKNHLASLKIRQEISDKQGISNSYNNIGLVYYDQGNYPEALKNHFSSLKIKEETGDQQGISNSYNNIGNVYYDQGNYAEALKSYQASLKIEEKIGNKEGFAEAYNNIGNVYKSLDNYPEALKNHLASLKIKEKLGNQRGIANSYMNIGNIYSDQGNYTEASRNYQACFKIMQEIEDEQGIAETYISIGLVSIKQGNYAAAYTNLNKGLKMAMEIGNKKDIKESYQGLTEAYEKSRDYTKAYACYKQYIAYRDSLYNEVDTKKSLQEQMQYEFDKKEQANNLIQEKELAVVAAESKRQRLVIWTAIVGLCVVLGFAGFIFRSLRLTKKQKSIIEAKNKNITDSITYAKRLQNAILPPLSTIQQQLPESFVLYKPKDIVAGDFYWFEQEHGFTYIAAADCTGHGVPGAMVSVVCANALNSALKEFKCTLPGQILDKTTELVIETFAKSDANVKDGMDISLLAIDRRNMQLHWAGANNPLYYFLNGELHSIAANKQPVGMHYKHTPFTTHTLPLEKGMALYLFTDGYADQFGGPEGKKMMTKRFKNTLLTAQTAGMQEQEQILSNTFDAWKAQHEQVDDVCVIGLSI